GVSHVPDGAAARPLRGDASPPRRRLPRDGLLSGRHRRPVLLGRALADRPLLRAARLGRVGRLRGVVRRALARDPLAAAARDRARPLPGRRSRPRHAVGGARRPARGVRPHRPREGRERGVGAREAHAAERADPDRHRGRDPARPAHGGLDRPRVRVRAARPRAVGAGRDHGPRPAGRAGRDPVRGVVAVGLGGAAGVLVGVLSGYAGGWRDEALMRLIDAVQGFPAILSALLFSAVFAPGVAISMIAIGIAFAPAFARLTRASFLELREREFVVAARALGAGDRRLIGRHILPNTLPPLVIQATTSFPVAILAEAALAYLGLGTQPPNPSWGLMLKEAQNFLSLHPSFAVFPGGAIALTVLGLNLLGDGLRDLLDPKTV